MSREQCVQPGGDGGILALLAAAPARLLTPAPEPRKLATRHQPQSLACSSSRSDLGRVWLASQAVRRYGAARLRTPGTRADSERVLIDYCRLSLHDGDDLSRCATCL